MINVKALDHFKVLYHLPPEINIVILIGGRGGAKTYEASKFVAFSSTIRKKRCVVLRDEKELIRESILNEILLRYDTANKNGFLDQIYERLDSGIKSRENNQMMVFTKGFRASSTEKTANMKSVSDIDIAVVEEAEDIRDETKFNTFADSIRKKGSLIIIILNTPDLQHWILKRYFNFEPARDEITGEILDGYFAITPKNIPGVLVIQTSFEDNPHLPNHIVDNYRNYGNPESHLFNKHYYLTAIKGYATTGRKGQVFSKARPIKLKDYLALPYKEYYGQDFGTSSPAGTVGVKIHRNTVWARQLNYKPKTTLDIAKTYCILKLTMADRIIADSADSKSISKLRTGWKGEELSEEEFRLYPQLRTGFNVIPSRKGTDSINFSVDLINGMNFFVVEESTDFWNEILNYIYSQDKYGNYTDDPIDDFNHLIDPTRYVVMDVVKGSEDYGFKRKN